MSWAGSQPTFGTIRRFLVAQDIALGSEVFLVLGDDGTFRIEPVDAEHDQPLDKALALVGTDDERSRREPRVALARAIGLPDDSLPLASSAGTGNVVRATSLNCSLLVKDQLADGTLPVRRPSAEINEILDLL